MLKKTLLTLLLLQGMLQAATAGETDTTRLRKLGVLPVPAFGHAPETGWYVGAVSLFTLQYLADTLTRTSNFKAEINYTQKKQLITALGWNYFSPADRYFFSGDLAYFKFPEDFYGIGSHTTAGMREEYDSKRLELRTTLLRQFRPGWFLGPRYQLQHMYNIEPQQDGLLATGGITGATGGTSSGAGLTLAYDRRDNLLNPFRGPYLSVSGTFFRKVLQSDFSFSRYEIDARQYFRLRKNDVLAVQALGIFTGGQPPFRMLPLLGSDSDMRGYYRGRYRDRQYLAFQTEYRLNVYRRWGLTAFGGFGDVANRPTGFTPGSLKPTFGGGIRFLTDRKENINLRLDFAFGQRTSGFYVAFGEAF